MPQAASRRHGGDRPRGGPAILRTWPGPRCSLVSRADAPETSALQQQHGNPSCVRGFFVPFNTLGMPIHRTGPGHRDVEVTAVTQIPAETPPHRYTAVVAGEIELRWQDFWEEQGTFRAPNPVGPLADPDHPRAGAEKLFVLDMFPYPSGAGLHVGHPLGYIGTDSYGRYQRMAGRNVLHAMGFDAFGLPAEQYAVQTGQHPRKTTEANVDRYRAQLRRLGLAYDDRRSVATTDVEFYRWTQWIFLQIFNSWYDPLADARPGRSTS